jgi:hypothetical protein
MFCFLRYSLDRQPAPGTEPQPAAPKNDRCLLSRMSTTYEEGLEPNLHLPALRSRTDRSRQATYEGKPHGRTANDRKNRSTRRPGQCLSTKRWLARVGGPIDRSTTSHSAARSHPRPAFGCRPKGDQPAPGCRLGVEGPKGGKIKEKVEGTGQRQASERLTTTISRHLG